MSVLQLNRVASLSRLLSPKSGGGGSRTRRTSASFAISNIGGLPSCPALSTAITPEREPGISKRGRVSSAPFMRRKGDPPGHREAHGSHCHNLHSSRPAPLQGALFGKPFSTTPYKQSTQDRVGFGDISFTLSSSPHCEVEQGMPKAPQLSFRSPVSQPKMAPFQPDLYAPMAKPASFPKISYSSMLGPLNGAAPLHSPEVAAIAAVLEPHRRSPAPESRPMLRLVRSTEDEHVLSVRLPGFAPEMVTICVRREDKLAVVADLWHAESNCHHEWLVAFSSRDANVLQTRAQFSADGTLTIHVPRHHGYSPRMRSRLR
ncbi:hypothetical protein ACEPAI_7303 [Sanghuangporus weigelae]